MSLLGIIPKIDGFDIRKWMGAPWPSFATNEVDFTNAVGERWSIPEAPWKAVIRCNSAGFGARCVQQNSHFYVIIQVNHLKMCEIDTRGTIGNWFSTSAVGRTRIVHDSSAHKPTTRPMWPINTIALAVETTQPLQHHGSLCQAEWSKGSTWPTGKSTIQIILSSLQARRTDAVTRVPKVHTFVQVYTALFGHVGHQCWLVGGFQMFIFPYLGWLVDLLVFIRGFEATSQLILLSFSPSLKFPSAWKKYVKSHMV